MNSKSINNTIYVSDSVCSHCNSSNVVYSATSDTPMIKDYPYLCNTCGHLLPQEIRNQLYIKIDKKNRMRFVI